MSARADVTSGELLAVARTEPRQLRRTVGWQSSIFLVLGGALLVTVSLGPMTLELGATTPWMWAAVAGVGGLQCLLLAKLAMAFPRRAGGTATYAHAVLGTRAPLVGAVSSWGYWFAWTPGITVNLILAAMYLRATVWPEADVLVVATACGILLYVINSLGLRLGIRAAVVLAVGALAPLAVILLGALANPSQLDLGRVAPELPAGRSWIAGETWLLMAKWGFVVAWAAYGAEMASTIVAEMRGGKRHAARALRVGALVGLAAFGLIPLLMLALVGVRGLGSEPVVALLPVAEAVLGDAGRTVVGVMLVCALILGAQVFVIGSSRTVFQMTCDGYLPHQFGIVNRRGAPVGSLLLDAAVIAVLIAAFGTHAIDVVAAANVGYLVVFALMPVVFLLWRRQCGAAEGLERLLSPIAVVLAAFNLTLLVVGGVQWGWRVMLTGAAVMAAIVPAVALRRMQDARAARPEAFGDS